MTKKIAALFVQKDGAYFGLDGVDPWDEARDARLYAGPHPVVAHPPCARWCRLAGFTEARWGYKKGDDGGCFESALNSVRTYGGVLEHPAYSLAWKKFDINPPPRDGCWVNSDFNGGWTCCVEQVRYGHKARKATWLYAFGCYPPSLYWGSSLDCEPTGVVASSKARRKAKIGLQKITNKEALASPIAFRDLLISIARSAKVTNA